MSIQNVKKFENLETGEVLNPVKFTNEEVSLLSDRVKDEYTAHYYYNAAANWCRNKNYKKAAAFFEAESISELEHAKKLQDFMTDWNVMPQVSQTETKHNFTDLVDIINGAYKMEYSLLQEYNKVSTKFLMTNLTIFDFLCDFRKIQTEATIEYSDLLNALTLINPNSSFELLYFEQTYF